MSGATYSSAGVNLELYEQSMARLPAHMRRTHCPRVMSAEGGFAALFRLDVPGLFKRRYREPLLVSCTDGVGTKLKLAVLANRHDTVQKQRLDVNSIEIVESDIQNDFEDVRNANRNGFL